MNTETLQRKLKQLNSAKNLPDTLRQSNSPKAKDIERHQPLSEEVSNKSRCLLEKKRKSRDFESQESDAYEDMLELVVLSRGLSEREAKAYLSEVISDYTLEEDKNKKYSDLILELDLSEGKLSKAAISTMFLKMRNKLKSAKSEKDKYKIFIDIIALSTFFTYDTVKTTYKELSRDIKKRSNKQKNERFQYVICDPVGVTKF